MTNKQAVFLGSVLAVLGLGLLLQAKNHNPTDIHKNAVMIVNRQMNHGGTGIIYKSGKNGSYILTNDHVCHAVKTGGIVRTNSRSYQINSILESRVNDLCFVFVQDNLGQNTKLASEEPDLFEPAKVSGHPALMPTVISTGHFSEHEIIQVFTGVQPCTAEQLGDDRTALMCLIFGGIPIIKAYDSTLVSATIMPGSSGSGVYNSNNELSGVVFAGQGDFGYAWTVTYDELVSFLYEEAPKSKFVRIDNTVTIVEKSQETKNIKDVLRECSLVKDPAVLAVCSILKKDVTWVK